MYLTAKRKMRKRGSYMIRGIGTSKGIGMGRALIVESPQMEISVKKIEDTAAEQTL